MTPAERLDQLNLLRQIVRVIWTDAMQFREQLRRDRLRLECFMPCTTRRPTALTDAKTACASSQSRRAAA